MTQKTFIGNEYQPRVSVGDEVILIETRREGCSASEWKCIPHTGYGIGGNLNENIKRYHGWRGTSYGVATYAHGIRKVLKVSSIVDPDTGYDAQKITVGKDLHPDWD